jgi:hypothetical protein
MGSRAPLLPLSHRKTCWTTWVDKIDLKICLLEILNFVVTLTFLSPWCKLKWSQDEFESQLQIL